MRVFKIKEMKHCFLVKEKKRFWKKVGAYSSFNKALEEIDNSAKDDYKVYCKWITRKSTNN